MRIAIRTANNGSLWGRSLYAPAAALAVALWAGPALATPPDDPEYEQEEQEDREEFYDDDESDDDGGYFLVSPGIIQVTPNINEIGYQWGVQAGYILRTDGIFAMGFGGSFEHGISDLGITTPEYREVDHQVRVQLEALPGVSLVDDRLFLHLTFGIGYAAWIQRWSVDDTDEIERLIAHGVAFSPGIGFSYRVWNNLTLGAGVGGDLQWFDPGDRGFEVHNVDVEVSIGWMF